MNDMLEFDQDDGGVWGIDKMNRRLDKLKWQRPSGDQSQTFMGRGEEGVLRNLASKTQQPYRSGWGALPGVATSIVGGMAGMKLRQNERAKAGAEKNAWGLIGNNMTGGTAPNWQRVMQSAPVGGAAHGYALERMRSNWSRDSKRNDPVYQARLKNMQLQNKRLESGGDRFTTVDVGGVTMQRGPKGRYVGMPGNGPLDFYEKTMQREKAKTDAKQMAEQQNKTKLTKNITAGMRNLSGLPEHYGSDFDGAIGPVDNSWIGRIGDRLTETFGYGKYTSDEVRSRINGDVEALAAAIKPMIRKPGEGAWTDADQERLVSVIGDLLGAKDNKEYYRRLGAVRSRVNSNFGLSIPKIVPSQKKPEKKTGQYSGASDKDLERILGIRK